MSSKEDLRRKMRAVRSALTPHDAHDKALSISLNVMRCLRPSIRCVGLYAHTQYEIDTGPMLAALVSRGIRVAFPRALVDKRRLSFHFSSSPTAMAVGKLGILEPLAQDPKASNLDVVIVPGLAFDRRGGRLGQGHGYYDRYLAESETMALGVAYESQLLEELPLAPHDHLMDMIVTESRIIDCRTERLQAAI